MLCYQIPEFLNPKLPPLEKINQTDSNYGISDEWSKFAVHFYLDSPQREKFNLPRIFWAKKTWTLK